MQTLRRFVLVAAVAVAVTAGFASAMQVDTSPNANAQPPLTVKEDLIERLREVRPDTLVTYAQRAIDRMEKTPQGIELSERVKASAMTCASCLNYVTMIMTVAKNEQLLNATKHLMVAECKLKRDECLLAVDVMVWALPKIFKALEGLAWDVPFNLCAMLFNNVCTRNCCDAPYSPEQVYITLADNKDFSKMRVTWVTLRDANATNVVYQADGGAVQTSVSEPTRTYTFGGWIGTINTAVMTGLKPDTRYTYSVGSIHNRSQSFSFRTFPTNIGTPERPARVMQIADMAYDGSSDNTVARIMERVHNGEVDLIVHNGDISYADGYMKHWDLFMRKVSPFTAYVPYLTAPGNHELYQNFTSYKSRLAKSMPRDDAALPDAMYYYVDLGPARLVILDSESWIDTADIPKHEVDWANKVLSAQDRTEQPFSLVFHHRPLYCNQRNLNCKEFAFILRLQAEELYRRNKVDMVIAGHVHYYLRSYPLYSGAVAASNYENPTAPVYVVNGAAGNREGNRDNGVPDHMYPYTSRAVGYSMMSIVSDKANNKHSVTYSFFDSATNERLDTFTINKNL